MKLITAIAIFALCAGCVTDSQPNTHNITMSGDTAKTDTVKLKGPKR